MKRRDFIKLGGLSAMGLLFGGCQFPFGTEAAPSATGTSSAERTTGALLRYQVTDSTAPTVYWTKEISPASIVRAYQATGRALTGRISLKLSFQSPNGPYIQPTLLKDLQQLTNGVFGDSNGFSSPRNTTEGHLRVAEAHGYTAVGPVDILDADGAIDIPVTGGKYLTHHRIGAHFADYDGVISLVKFKPHHLEFYGGTLKNLTICLADTSGKAIIHSAGRVDNRWAPADNESFLESVADATKAAVDFKKDRYVFINILSDLVPDDDCSADALPNLGVLASTDPVALDQAAVDMTFGRAPDDATRETWEEHHFVRVLGYAEERGAGQRHYQLVEI